MNGDEQLTPSSSEAGNSSRKIKGRHLSQSFSLPGQLPPSREQWLHSTTSTHSIKRHQTKISCYKIQPDLPGDETPRSSQAGLVLGW